MAEFSQYQYFIDQVAGLLKAETKRLLQFILYSKQKWCDLEQKWCGLKQQCCDLGHEWCDLEQMWFRAKNSVIRE